MQNSKLFGNSLFYTVFSSLILLHLALIVLSRLYPFTDIPNHLGVATVLRYYTEPGNMFSEYYNFTILFKPNVSHQIFCSSPIFPSVEFANKVYIGLYVVLLPISVLLVITKLKGNKWFSLLSFLVIYNYTFTWGFANFFIAIPLLIFLFYLILDCLEKGGVWYYVIIGFILILIYFVHLLVCFLALALYLAIIFTVFYKSIKDIALRILPAIPVITILIIYSFVKFEGGRMSLAQYFLKYYSECYFGSEIINRSLLLVGINYGLFDGLLDNVIALCFALFIIGIAFGSYIFHWSKMKTLLLFPTLKPVLVFFFLTLGITLILPPWVQLFQRFPVFWHLSIIFIGSVLFKNNLTNIKIILIGAVCLIHFVLWAEYMIGFQKENTHFAPDSFTENTNGETMGGLIYDYKYRGTNSYIHFPKYFIVWKKGISTSYTIDDGYGKMERKADFDMMPVYEPWIGKFKTPYEGKYKNLDLLLIRGEIPEWDKHHFDESRLRSLGSDWYIYEN